MSDYESFLATKVKAVEPAGFEACGVSDKLFPFQREVVRWACRQGRAALFADTGLGKSLMQLAWADQVVKYLRATGRALARALILAPLAVGAQTLREAKKFGFENVKLARSQSEVEDGITITNYEMLHAFDPSAFGGVVLDESGILKNFSGTTKRRLCEAFAATPFRLACTATPAPNDHMELGNHAEFLGIMSSHEMLARWFIVDASTFGTYRLKGHAVMPFWDWVCSWARCIGKPSDLDPEYSDEGYILPELEIARHSVDVDVTEDRGEFLFRMPRMSATDFHKEKRRTAGARAAKVASLVKAEKKETWLIWCETDYEADALLEAVPKAVDVRGSMTIEQKTKCLVDFADGKTRVMITKPGLAGMGLNLQVCARMAFVGPGYSYEGFYQAVRRCWRFGQKRPVTAHVVMASTELAVWDVVMRKAGDHEQMKAAMFAASRRAQSRAAGRGEYRPTVKMTLPKWLRGAA